MTPQERQKLPKVELHRHLEGAIRLSTLIDLSLQHGVKLPTSPSEREDYFFIRQPMKDLATVLDRFTRTQILLSTPAILTRITVEAIEEAVHEGLRAVELRFAPDFILEGHANLTSEKIIEAVIRGVELCKHLPIAVGLLVTFVRTKPMAQSLRLAEVIMNYRDQLAGVDLADAELAVPCAVFVPLFNKLRDGGFPITIHAGETPEPASVQNMHDAIDLLGATRIGHGVMSIKDPRLLQKLRDKKITLEVCVSSNWITQAFPKIADHPVKKLIDRGVQVSLNSDDPSLFGINLLHEYEVLERQFAFDESLFLKCNRIAAANSFIPRAEIYRHAPELFDDQMDSLNPKR